jgi:hypothetical protein
MRTHVVAGLAVLIVLGTATPSPAQSKDVRPRRDVRLDIRTQSMAIDGDPAALILDRSRALSCARGGGCVGSAGTATLVGTGAGAGLALLYVLVRCVPQGAAGEHVECGGRVPLVMIGAGSVAGLVSGLASRRCRSD